MEGALGIRGKLIEFLDQRKLLSFEGISACAEGVQCLTVLEEYCLLTLVNDELRAEIEVLNGVLPHEGVVVTLVFYDACKAVLLNLFGYQALLHVVLKIADGAGVCSGRL